MVVGSVNGSGFSPTVLVPVFDVVCVYFCFYSYILTAGSPLSSQTRPHASLCLSHKVVAIRPHLQAGQSVTSLVAAGTSALVYSVISGHQLPI